jgi:hypothetical protein
MPHTPPPPSVPGMVNRLPTGGGPHPSNLPAPLHKPPKPAAEPLSRRKSTTAHPKPPYGQAADLVAAMDTHTECRGATPLQQSTMPAPSRGWKPPSTTTPERLSRQRKTMMDPRPADGQVAAPVTVASTHPEHRSSTPRQRSTMPPPLHGWKPWSTPIPGPSRGWKTATAGPRPPIGQAVAPIMAKDTHPEHKGGHPLPQPPSVMLKSWHR